MTLLSFQEAKEVQNMEKEWFLKGADRLEQVYFSPIRQVEEKANALAKEGHPVIKFSIGEPDFNTPEPIKAATIQAIKENKTHYASNRGLLELRQCIAQKLKENNGLEYDPETEILVTSGGAEVINDAFLAVLNPGDEVIVFTPAFMNYENLIHLCGAKMVGIPLKEENGFQIDPAAVKARITERTRMIVLNNPSNPLGIVFKEEVLEEIAKIAVQYNLLVFTDEMYNEILYDGVVCRSIASFPDMKIRTITMNGFSKTYAMTGWRVGYVAADSRVISNILKVHQYATTCSPTFIQYGLAAAMNSPETVSEVKKMVQVFDHRRKLVMAGLDKIGKLTYIVPEGAFYIFVNVSQTGMDGDEFASKLLNEFYVATVPGTKLGDWCKDYIRISYATSDQNLEEGLSRMDRFVNHK